MSESSKAVFLSYASQDAEVAKRICDALRTAGVEVWFDAEGGLEHGDEWDAKIRRQIKECVLFLPIISANTQAREEGYFRLEWDLAAERARGIASGVAFILPVVIDDTRQPDALVPDRFRTVQWTKLPGGVVPPEVLQRFLKLWSHRTGLLKHKSGEPFDAAHGRQGARSTEQEVDAAPRQKLARWLMPVIAGGVMALVALALTRPWEKAAPPPVESSAPRSTPATAASAEARSLVAKAWELMNKPDLARAELELADGYCRQATELEPNDADAWAAWSQMDSWTTYHNFDRSPARRDAARTKAARAAQLDPRSYEARLARACQLVRGSGDVTVSAYAPEAGKLLAALLQEKPDEPRALLALGILQRNLRKVAEFRETFARLAQNPAWAVKAWNELGWAEYLNGNPSAAGPAGDRSIALQPYWANLLLKLSLAQRWRGDLEEAKVTVEQLPLASWQEDIGICVTVDLHYWRRDPQAMLKVLDAVPRDWLQSNAFDGPKAYWAAIAHRMSGHEEAARLQWRTALGVVERRLDQQPDSPGLNHWKGLLLAESGDRTAAAPLLRLAREMGYSNRDAATAAIDALVLGDLGTAIDHLEHLVSQAGPLITAAAYRLNPVLDPLRSLPRFQALVARMEADPRFSPKAKADPVTTSVAAPAVDDKSIAVLPFANLSPEKDNEFFADGMHEDILTHLGEVRALRVTSRTSVMQYRGTAKTIRQIGSELGVAYLLEGSVRRAGNKVRVTGQLINARTDEHLWAKSYDRDLTDIFSIQSELAQAIAGALSATLSPQEKTLIEKRPTENLVAYDLFLKARANYFLSSSDLSAVQVEELLREAVKLDPAFAQAWAYLGWRHARAYFDGDDHSADRLAQAKAAIETAVRLAPDDPEVIEKLGHYYYYGYRDYVRAAEQYQRLLQLRPNSDDAHAYLGYLYRRQGRWAEGLVSLREAARLAPLHVGHLRSVADTLVGLRRYDEATAAWRLATELSAGDVRIGHNVPLMAYLARGSTREMDEWLAAQQPAVVGETKLLQLRRSWARLHGDWAQAVAIDRQHPYLDPWDDPHWVQDFGAIWSLLGAGEKAAARSQAGKLIPVLEALAEKEPSNARLWGTLGLLHAFQGDQPAALRCSRQARQLLPESVDALIGPNYSMIMAQVLAWTGDLDGALREAARLLRVPFGDNPLNVHSARHDPGWLPLQGDPRFEALLNDPKNNEPLF